jgi:hypothetical protein
MNSNTAKEHLNRRPTRHARHGKVARLPEPIREAVNRMLNDGVSYPRIVRHLASSGYPGFSVHSISRWKLGGYEDWLLRQEKHDMQKLDAELFLDMIKDVKDPATIDKAAHTLAALATFRTLDRFGNCSGDDLTGPRGKVFLSIMRTCIQQNAEQTRREQLAFRQTIREDALVDHLVANPKKLDAFLNRIRERVAGSSQPAAKPTPNF